MKSLHLNKNQISCINFFFLANFVWIFSGVHGQRFCESSAQVGTDLEIPFSHTSNINVRMFRILDRQSQSIRTPINCGKTSCTNTSPSKYTGVTTSTVSRITLHNMQRYETELILNYRVRRPGNKVDRCRVQVFNFTSDPYCLPSSIAINNGSFFLTFRCGIKDVYPPPLCKFEIRQEANPDTLTELDTLADAGIPHGDPAVYGKECYVHLPLSSVYPRNYDVIFYAAPGTRDGMESHNKNVTIDTVVVDGPNITCDGPRINPTSNKVEVLCELISYFSNVTCEFSEIMPGAPASTVNEDLVTTTNGHCSDEPKGCQTLCTFSKDVGDFVEGTYSYQVSMTPYLKDAATPDNYTVSSNTTDDIEIKLPTVQLVDCPLDDSGDPVMTKKGDRVTCTCNMTDPGLPKGKPQWYSSDNDSVGTLVGDVAHLTHDYNSTDNNPNYTCKGVSAIGKSSGATLVIEYSSGPTSVTAGSPSPTPYDLCPSSSPGVGIAMTCSVPQESVSPGANVTLTGVSIETYTPTSSSVQTNTYVYEFQVNLTSPGKHRVKCVAANSLSGHLISSDDKTIVIREPPSSPPVLTLKNGQVVSDQEVLRVMDGEDFYVGCHVIGGYPEVTNVSLTCAGVDNFGVGFMTSQRFNVNSSLHGDRCVCSAEHVTGCYTRTTEMSFFVESPPKIEQYFIQGQSSEVTVQAGTNVNMECIVKANPTPQVKVKSQKSDETLTADTDQDQGQFMTSFRFTKVLSRCLDTDVYSCVVGNVSPTSIQVFVQCQPELRSQSENSTRLVLSDSDSVTSVSYSILSHPVPSLFSLTRQDGSGQDVEIPQEQYQVTVGNSTSPPYSQLSLKIYELNSEDSGRYVFTVSNSIGDSLNISLILDIPAGGSQVKTLTAAVSGGVAGGIVILAVVGAVAHQILKRPKSIPTPQRQFTPYTRELRGSQMSARSSRNFNDWYSASPYGQ